MKFTIEWLKEHLDTKLNDKKLIDRSMIIREKGTNRSKFLSGQVDKYSWIDIGSSFLPSEIVASFLWAQFEDFENIMLKRSVLWNYYFDKFKKIPQVLKNIEVKDKSIIKDLEVKKSIKLAEELMKGQGRILVRESGTESKIRIMGESENKKLLIKCMNIISKKIK